MRAVVAFIVAVCLSAADSRAQPFSSVDVGLGAAANVRAPDLDPWWADGVGGDLSVRMPFYFGVLEAGAAVHRHSSRDVDVPPFSSVHAFAGWGMRSRSAAGFRIYAGGRLGLFTMVFAEGPTVRNPSRYESEMTLAPLVALQGSIGNGWSVFAEAQHLLVFTADRLHVTSLTAGFRLVLDTPGWLRNLLE